MEKTGQERTIQLIDEIKCLVRHEPELMICLGALLSVYSSMVWTNIDRDKILPFMDRQFEAIKNQIIELETNGNDSGVAKIYFGDIM